MIIPDVALPWMRIQRPAGGDRVKAIGNEVTEILPWLEGCVSVCEIGCGVGIASVLLAQRGFVVTAVDKPATTKKPKYGKAQESYNDMAVTRAVFDANLVDVELLESLPDRSFDAVVSFYSWGFHYPLDAYSPNSDLWIVDLRPGMGNVKAEVICAKPKADRVAIRGGLK